MSDPLAREVWEKLLAEFEDKMQFAFLDLAREVIEVRLEDEALTLLVSDAETEQFFNNSDNQQRIFIASRSLRLPFHRIKVLRGTRPDYS